MWPSVRVKGESMEISGIDVRRRGEMMRQWDVVRRRCAEKGFYFEALLGESYLHWPPETADEKMNFNTLLMKLCTWTLAREEGPHHNTLYNCLSSQLSYKTTAYWTLIGTGAHMEKRETILYEIIFESDDRLWKQKGHSVKHIPPPRLNDPYTSEGSYSRYLKRETRFK